MEPEYRVKADGTVVMSYDMFRSMSFKELCKMLGIVNHPDYAFTGR